MNNINIKKSKVFLFLYAIGSVIIIPLVGQLTFSEILVAVSVPFLSYKTLFSKFKSLNQLLVGFTILFFGQVISDIINQSAVSDFSRGWALLLSSFFSTLFLISQFSKNESNLLYFIFLLFIVQLFFGYDGGGFNSMEIGDNYFKYRFAVALNMLTILLSCYYYKRGKKNTATIIIILNGIVSILFAARSNGLILIVSGIILFFKANSIQLNFKKIFKYAFTGTILLYILYVIYANQVVNHDFGGMNSKNQFALMSNIYNPFELIKYGRTDFFVTLYAIVNKPVFGYGSWPADPGGYYSTLLNILSGEQLFDETGHLPIHSILLGTWATAGLIGLLGTLYLFFSLFKRFFKIYVNSKTSVFLPLVIVLTIDMFWTFLFSPLSALRSSFPLFAAAIIIEFQQLQNISGNNLSNQTTLANNTLKNI